MITKELVVLELIVRNHPGTMSHITGMFSRRGFNIEGIICAPKADEEISRMLLVVDDGPRRMQLIAQIEKLYDVMQVIVRTENGRKLCNALREQMER